MTDVPISALAVTARHETWPLREAFKISRGAKSAADVVVVTVSNGQITGRGEAVPYGRYGETIEGTLSAISNLQPIFPTTNMQNVLPAGAARNALDCALGDFLRKDCQTSVAHVLRVGDLKPVLTAFTLSLDTPEVMAAKARDAHHLPLLKLKLGGAGDADRMRAVRAARPDARLIADANEAWTPDMLPPLLALAAELGFETIEQPLPEGADDVLRTVHKPLPVCADESVHTVDDLPRLAGLYEGINIKLDKAGGLVSALELQRAARACGMKIMVGSMVATSLAIAPALILAQDAEWTDLDGPLLLARDREHGVQITDGVIAPPSPALWG